MKYLDNHLTTEEVERLCELYLGCRLSVLEEAELEYVLMHCDLASSVIEETKELMVTSRFFKFEKDKKTHNNVWLTMRVAACVAIILGGIAFYRNNTRNHSNVCSNDCIVYIAGKKANKDDARKIAEADVAKMRQFLQVVDEQKAKEKAKVEHFLNHINQSK